MANYPPGGQPPIPPGQPNQPGQPPYQPGQPMPPGQQPYGQPQPPGYAPPGQPGQPQPPPYGQPYQPGYGPGGQPPGYPPGYPRPGGGTPGKLMAPAIALLAVGVIDLLNSIWMLIQSFMPRKIQEIPEQLKGDEFWEGVFKQINEADPSQQIIMAIVWFLLALILVAGGIGMLTRKMYAVAITATVLAIIPCTGIMDCCLLIEVGIGIWAMVVLFDGRIKQLFS